MQTASYPWAAELEKTVVHSLCTSFGLDFLLFKDQDGGNVDTVHNVRKGVWATDAEAQRYQARGSYADVKSDYHQDKRYTDRGKADAALQEAGELKDGYTKKTLPDRKGIRNLDHVISAKSVHDDAGRILADIPGVDLASVDSNLESTHQSVNKSKQALSVNDYLNQLPQKIKQEQRSLAKDRKVLDAMPQDTPAQRHAAQALKDKIRKNEAKLEEWKAVDPAAMRKKDRAARKEYNGRINREYYTSSKFWGATLTESGDAGLRMGTRQMLGLIAAEIWFELREALPRIVETMRQNFSLEAFLKETRTTLQGIWKRVRARFQAFLTAFKDGAFAGILGSATTTLFNIFATTAKNAVKIIREMWTHMVSIIKLTLFNPDKLSGADLARAVVTILSAGVATAVGSLVYAQLAAVQSFPFGGEIAAFLGALVTGIVTMGLQYVLLHSKMMASFWDFLDRSSHAKTLREFEALNEKLDEYLAEIARVELNIDTQKLETFSLELNSARTEGQRGTTIAKEIKTRDIDLPFEMGNTASTRDWLASLAK